jgi:molecular chaperone HscA
VTFQVDADGLLSVTAQEKISGVEAHVTVKPSYGLADEDITRMLRDSTLHAREDMQARALAEQQVEAAQMIEAVENAIVQDADLLADEERDAVRESLAALRATLESTDHRAIKDAISRVNEATEPFAARRMDRNVAKALTGHRITELAP